MTAEFDVSTSSIARRPKGRPREARARTISARGGKTRLAIGATLFPERPGIDYERPRTRGECLGGIRPCPFVSCRENLYLDVTKRGGLKLNFPDIEPHEMKRSCALDVADEGPHALDELREAMNATREGVRQMELAALRSFFEAGVRGPSLRDEFAPEGGSRWDR